MSGYNLFKRREIESFITCFPGFSGGIEKVERHDDFDIPPKIDSTLFLALGITIPAILIGCTPAIKNETPDLSGTFRGIASERQPVSLTFCQKGNTVTGNCSIGGRLCSLSGITSHHGLMVITFEDGRTIPAKVTLSPDTDMATIQGLDNRF